MRLKLDLGVPGAQDHMNLDLDVGVKDPPKCELEIGREIGSGSRGLPIK